MAFAGDKIRASDIEDRVGVRLRRAAVQSATTASPLTISWDTEDEDTDGFWSSGTTVTIPSGFDGLYVVTARAALTLTASTRSFIDIQPTSAVTGMPGQFRYNGNASDGQLTVTANLPLLAGDSFVCTILQSTGSSQNTTSWLSCYRYSI